MFSSFGANALGVLFLILFGVFYWLGIFATLRAILAFAGTCLLGTAGFLGSLFNRLATSAVHLADSGTAFATGVALGGTVLVVITGVVFVHDLMPKHTAGKRTGWAGIALAALLLAGASSIPALNNLPSSVTNGVTTVTGG
jgi:apolipoprotein N-acyltransferase